MRRALQMLLLKVCTHYIILLAPRCSTSYEGLPVKAEPLKAGCLDRTAA